MSDKPERAMAIGRLRRGVVPAMVALKGGARWMGTYRHRGSKRTAAKEAAMLRTSEEVTATLGNMKGAAMKLGQVLSLMTGAVPEPLAAQLATLQQDAPPMSYELVESAFREGSGTTPERLFRRFDRTPFASASIGQVHRAELRDGTTVAVKVQYPGVREAIDHDLANVAVLLRLGGVVARGLDVDALATEIAAGIREELDYENELANQQRFFDHYAGHAFVKVPRVYDELSGPTVLVQEYVEGKPFREAYGRSQAERNRIAEIIYRFSFGNIYRFGLFNGDPHPGNYLLLDDGGVAFVDYGLVAEFEPLVVSRLAGVIEALLADDVEQWRGAVEELGILHAGAPFSTGELFEHMHWYWKPLLEPEVTFTPELAAEMIRRNTQTTGPGGAINRHCNIPKGTVFLTRINFGLAGLLGGLQARGPWRSIIEEYVRDVEPATELGRISKASSPGRSV